ncbi:MAG: hypothetical protein IH798_04145 [Gemmatimonadetes bacterium]|nr:hypothetical protein [Gemmatimonadota bacterium]
MIINTFFDNAGMDLETLYAGHWWNYQLWNGSSGWLQVTHRFERVARAFELGDGVSVPAGDHRFTSVWFNYSAGPGSLFRTTFDLRVGSFYDGRQVQVKAKPVWNISRFLELSGEYEGNFLRFPGRDAAVDIHLARLRLRAATSARLSAAVLAQYDSVSDLIGINLRIRYNVREGTDFWFVYDEGLNSERTRDNVERRLPLSETRAVRVKFTYTLAL